MLTWSFSCLDMTHHLRRVLPAVVRGSQPRAKVSAITPKTTIAGRKTSTVRSALRIGGHSGHRQCDPATGSSSSSVSSRMKLSNTGRPSPGVRPQEGKVVVAVHGIARGPHGEYVAGLALH